MGLHCSRWHLPSFGICAAIRSSEISKVTKYIVVDNWNFFLKRDVRFLFLAMPNHQHQVQPHVRPTLKQGILNLQKEIGAKTSFIFSVTRLFKFTDAAVTTCQRFVSPNCPVINFYCPLHHFQTSTSMPKKFFPFVLCNRQEKLIFCESYRLDRIQLLPFFSNAITSARCFKIL